MSCYVKNRKASMQDGAILCDGKLGGMAAHLVLLTLQERRDG